MMRPMSLGLAALFVTAVAQAQTEKPPQYDISGAWTFIADLDPACDFTGNMALYPTGEPGEYECELVARQVCEPFVRFVVEQSCTVEVDGNELMVFSTIERFVEGEPTPFYYPDNFRLTIKSDSRMVGNLVSSDNFRAVFERNLDGIS